MKRVINFFVLIFITAYLFSSCEKDDPGIVKNKYRISSYTYDDPVDSFDYRLEFNYKSEKLNKLSYLQKDENGEWVENVIVNYIYKGNTVTGTVKYTEEYDSDNEELDEIYNWNIENGLVNEITYSEKVLNEETGLIEEVVYSKSNYVYEERKLMSWKIFSAWYSDNNTLHESQNGLCVYLDGQLATMKKYDLMWDNTGEPLFDQFYLYNEDQYTYVNDNITHIDRKYYDQNGEITSTYSIENSYSNGLITDCSWEVYNAYSNSNYSYNETYSYDANGEIAKIVDGDGNSTLFEFEKGNGNASLVYPGRDPNYFENIEQPYFKSASLIKNNKPIVIPKFRKLKHSFIK